MSRFQIGNHEIRLGQAILALACFAVAALPARAQFDDATFSLKISEKAKAITDPTNTALQNFLMWDLGSDRVMNRNMPYLELENLHDTQPITEFRMTVGDPRFHFDCEMLQECAMVAESPGGLSISSSIIAGTGDQSPSQGGELVLNFGNNGLAPGEKVLFKIALGVDEAYDFFHRPDFRTVLFDMNEINVYDGNLHLPNSVDDTSDNAKVTVKFGANGGSFVVGPVSIDDYNVEGEAAKYFNDHFRQYGVMEHVDTFLVIGGIGSEIPEPSAVMLAMVAAIGGLCSRRSRRRAA
jgi:hypothetical protein